MKQSYFRYYRNTQKKKKKKTFENKKKKFSFCENNERAGS